ncbi:MAG: [FeFe] hydrogenase H-cluster radical SAM maturase HydG [Ichthyobacteriaceae bacterium]|nr:[FeFe] hydrogenase H-cluster radical SAM maturase HydG [Ichthyobacteriaceae bacterium]
MKFEPQQYKIADERMKPFIDAEEIWDFINNANTEKKEVRKIIAKAINKERLNLAEVASLVQTTDKELIEEIKQGAIDLKKKVYGNRIVLFAPLYVGNLCANNCEYCGFKASNKEAKRVTLSDKQLIENVEALEDNGHKRLILVYGEHKKYSPEAIADNVRTVYKVKKGNGEIRRVNINAAPLDIEGFRTIKDAGIGTYQVFQETYNPEAYKVYHTSGKKSDFVNRLTSLDRAQEAELDDVGIGALFGLYDWRYEVLGLVRHANHLEACYNVGPHTISFPRIQESLDSKVTDEYIVSDDDFTKLVAILRLAVPYTGLILTARETQEIRKEVLQFGCSQIDAGTKIEMGAYADDAKEEEKEKQKLDSEQFLIGDERSLADVIDELVETDYIPSFCTACYRKGRTGEHFMEFSVPGFIKKFCTPNAILTLSEYIEDYARPETKQAAWDLIERNLSEVEPKLRGIVEERIEKVKQGERDLYF